MVQVNEDLTRKVAHLARLKLSEQEVKAYTAQLKDVLSYIDQLQKVKTDGVEPMVHPHELEIPLREDDVESFPVTEEGTPKVLKDAPEVLYDGYKVPPIL